MVEPRTYPPTPPAPAPIVPRLATTPRDRTKTKQDYLTPPDVLEAVERRFGHIVFDLAASDGQEVRPLLPHFTPEQDALAAATAWPHNRHAHGVLWLNPPYSPDIYPWSEKCAAWRLTASPGLVLTLLVPYSADSEWWRDHVRGKAQVLALKSRPHFQDRRVTSAAEMVGDGYPKPTALVVYDPRYPDPPAGDSLWDWRALLR